MAASNHLPALVFGGALLGALTLGACNEHVFRYVPDVCKTDIVADKEIEPSKPADILVVVDNSGSMCEEQSNLAANFFVPPTGNPDTDCPITDLENVPNNLKNPSPEQAQELATKCGFIQLLAAYDNDFRVGIITTDVSPCDNDFDQASSGLCGTFGDWGRRKQRGCLQAPPGVTGAAKVLKRSDKAADFGGRDIGARFTDTLNNVRTFGSAVERGLDATKYFLDANASRDAECAGDLDNFLRDEAKLAIIYLTDEEDCSHDDGANGFDDQGSDTEDNCADSRIAGDPSACYPGSPNSQFDKLAPVQGYVDFLNNLKGAGRQNDVSVAVIAGALKNNGTTVAGDCTVESGAPSGTCNATLGNSNNPTRCGPGGTDEPCCLADQGTRYFALADAFGGDRALKDSICFASFRSTMIAIADFVGRTDFVNLSEAPSDPEAIVVTITPAGGEPEVLKKLDEGADCGTEDGFQLLNGTRVQFCGSKIPQTSDRIGVHAAASRGDAGCILTN